MPEPVKCDNVGADGICGTPDDGGEQQPVDDNGGLDAPTESYIPGDAEETIGNQPHCGNGVVCGTTPTEDGTVVDGSENGGLAPGGAVDVPVVGDNGAGGVNPGADGTAPSTNPDLGTAAPEDTPISNDTVGSDQADWDSGFSLPGIAPAPAPVVESNYVAPAPAAPTYVEPAQQTGATQQVNDEPATVSSFSEPADDSSFSADTSDQSSTLATVTDITSASSHSSSTLDDSTSSSSSGASSFNSDSGSASDSTSSIDDSLMGAA
ncbi:hypothetical protein HY312_02005 [Candidatus Saccharibacteria bacterium]|nr:hypothetical protein [Candidatus Saccharibacteria bacterium]